MEDKDLVCEYCNLPIKESDHKCPNCGANCTKIIREYQKKKKEQQDIIDKKRAEQNRKVRKKMNITFVIILVFSLLMIAAIVGIIVFAIYKQTSKADKYFDWSEGSFVSKSDGKKVVVKYKEKAKTKDMSVILDNYEFYEYKADEFPDSKELNTPEGYQKIAFHFVVENTGTEDIITAFGFDVDVTADDYAVKKAGLSQCMFCRTVSGKSSYESLESLDIKAGSKLQGYLGFMVPKDKKNLKFMVGDNITIKMDNPAYEK